MSFYMFQLFICYLVFFYFANLSHTSHDKKEQYKVLKISRARKDCKLVSDFKLNFLTNAYIFKDTIQKNQ